MKRLSIFIILLVIGSQAWASDTHQDGQQHGVIYTVTDSSGDPVSGLSPRVALKRLTDGLYFDFNDSTWKAPGSATTLFQTMAFEQAGGFYMRIFTMDNATLASMDVICVISLDHATYGDTQSESIGFDNLNNLIKMRP